jgi:catechol 2,3-dioxygenase-like lactoylglutathione lyase family enzyme
MSDLQMKVGFVVLYVNDVEACVRFWVEKVGMVERARTQVGAFHVVKVGFANQDFSFDLVPLELMRENPDGLDLATPSAAFHVPDLDAARGAGGAGCAGERDQFCARAACVRLLRSRGPLVRRYRLSDGNETEFRVNV